MSSWSLCAVMLTPNALRIRRRCWSQAPNNVISALELTTDMVDSIIY
jgi:hypothetical protein